MASNEYYYTDGSRTFGPFSITRMQEMAASGAIHQGTLIAAAGDSQWKAFAASDLARANAPQSAAPPSAPPRGAARGVADGLGEVGQAVANHGIRLGNAIAGISGRVVEDIQELRLQLLLPFGEISSLAWIRDRSVVGVLVVGLWPLLCTQLLGQDYEVAYWAIAFYFSAIWALFFYRAFAPAQVAPKKAAAAFFCTGLVSIPILLAIYWLPPLSWLADLADQKPFLLRFPGMLIGVAIPEEIFKALVLLVILRLSDQALHPKTLLFYGLMSGLGFGIYEGVGYQMGSNLTRSANPLDYYLANVMRLTSLPFLHAVWTGLAGYFLAFSSLFPARRYGLVVVAILIPAFFHGLHNSLRGVLQLALDSVAILTLLMYLAKSTEIEAGFRGCASGDTASGTRP